MSTGAPANTASSEFERWKHARDGLTRAIDNYMDASSTLCSTLSASIQSAFPRQSLELILNSLDTEFRSLCSDEARLEETRTALSHERNKAHSIVSIHRLPSEILATIFAFSSDQYVRYDRSNIWKPKAVAPIVLASVCSSWRALALRSPSLWTCIRVVVGGLLDDQRYKQAALWVERSAKLPLDLEVHDYAEPHSCPTRSVWPHQIMRLVEFLRPFMARVRALYIEFRIDSGTTFSSVVELWIKSGATAPRKTLQIMGRDGKNSIVIGPSDQVSLDEFNAFFRTVNKVTLRDCRISKHVPFHAGLAELCLGRLDSNNRLTQRDLVAILSATPRLRILSLSECLVRPSRNPPPPVTLNHLDSLCLEAFNTSHSFADVLPLLNVGHPALNLILTLDDSAQFIDAVHNFFDRTKVVRLFVKKLGREATLRSILYPMRHLETLLIEWSEISDEVFGEFLNVPFDEPSQPPWPLLHTAYFRSCSFDMRCLQKLALVHSQALRKVHLYDPRIIGGEPDITEEECDELEESMDEVEDFEIFIEAPKCVLDDGDFSILDLF